MVYKIKLWFEHGGPCLWSADDSTREVYGYPIDHRLLPLNDITKIKLTELTEKYRTYLDWSDPGKSSIWTEQEKAEFVKSSDELYLMLKNDLGNGFLIVNEVRKSVY